MDAVGCGVSEADVNAAGIAGAMRAGADFVRYLIEEEVITHLPRRLWE